MSKISFDEQPLVDALMPMVYDELKRMARGQLARERAGHTLTPTALVHEAWIKLRNVQGVPNDKHHFMALAARAMRHILVNHALANQAAKRDGGERLSLANVDEVVTNSIGSTAQNEPLDLIALDAALTKLEARDPRAAKLAELRAFTGLSLEQAADALDISTATAKRDWTYAKLWLLRELRG